MQQYIQNRCSKIDIDYSQRESRLRNEKEKDCQDIRISYNKYFGAYEKKKKHLLLISAVISIGIGIFCFSHVEFMLALIIFVGLCAASYNIIISNYKKNIEQVANNLQAQINLREKKLSQDLYQLSIKKAQELKQLESSINHEMNQYRLIYEKGNSSVYIVEWILNALSIEIKKADRSRWLPQVKTYLRFNVSSNNIEIPGFGNYNMSNQGISIDNNPMSIGALAYVLENKTIAEARMRFMIDPNGGRAVFTSSRYDTSVEIHYSAPNGKAGSTH